MLEKYLITGATGFLGRTVLAQLQDSPRRKSGRW